MVIKILIINNFKEFLLIFDKVMELQKIIPKPKKNTKYSIKVLAKNKLLKLAKNNDNIIGIIILDDL
jgi:hypothetical protein